MFVINANGQNSGYSCVEVNNNYNPPMDGSSFNMFGYGTEPSKSCFCFVYRDVTDGVPAVCCLIYNESGRNGCCTCSSSLLEYAKVNKFDEEVYFPNNINNDSGSAFSVCRDIYTFVCTRCTCNCLGDINYTLPENLFYSIATKKQFSEGICIGKKINGYLGIYVVDNAFANIRSSSCCPTVYRDTGICFHIGYGLLHTDGTIDYFDQCSFLTSGGCYISGSANYSDVNNYGSCIGVASIYVCTATNLCCYYSLTNPNLNILYGEKTTCGLTTREGDRLILRMRNDEACGNIYFKTTSSCSVTTCASYTVPLTKVVLYGGTQTAYGWGGCGPCYFNDKDVGNFANHVMNSIIDCGQCCISNVKICKQDSNLRFGGIQFSIE